MTATADRGFISTIRKEIRPNVWNSVSRMMRAGWLSGNSVKLWKRETTEDSVKTDRKPIIWKTDSDPATSYSISKEKR